MNTRPFRILGVQQIAVGHTDKTSMMHLWCKLLGMNQVGSFVSEQENVDEQIMEVGAGACTVELDLMQPLDPSRSPKVHQPALNHIGLWVDELQAAYHWLSEQGVRFAPGGIRAGASGYEVCFIHPKGSEQFPLSGLGVLIELVQAPVEIIEYYEAQRYEQRDTAEIL